MAQKQDSASYFVNIDAPVEVRKVLVEASSLVIDSCKKYEQYKRTTQQKLAQMQALRNVLNDIKQLNAHILSALPKVHLQYKGEIEETTTVPGLNKQQLKKIEQEIASIEQELSVL
jgi:hypothetical protein